MIYLDNAATTYPKPEVVYTFMDDFYRANGASVGRGNYEKAMSVSHLLQDTRKRLQKLLNCYAKQVVFTPTATIALNIILQGLFHGERKTVYITPFEHNAVTRTLHHFEGENTVEVFELTVSRDLQYDLDAIKRQFSDHKPDVLIMSHGISPVTRIAKNEKGYNRNSMKQQLRKEASQ